MKKSAVRQTLTHGGPAVPCVIRREMAVREPWILPVSFLFSFLVWLSTVLESGSRGWETELSMSLCPLPGQAVRIQDWLRLPVTCHRGLLNEANQKKCFASD